MERLLEARYVSPNRPADFTGWGSTVGLLRPTTVIRPLFILVRV